MSHSVVSDSLWPRGLYSPWNSPGQNTGVGSLFLLQGIFPTQGLNPGLLHCKQILYQLSHEGSTRLLEWVACPFASGSSWPRNWTGVFCIAGGFFTSWAIREAPQADAKVLFYFCPQCTTCRILVPQAGIESSPSAVKAPSPNHWTTREFSRFYF